MGNDIITSGNGVKGAEIYARAVQMYSRFLSDSKPALSYQDALEAPDPVAHFADYLEYMQPNAPVSVGLKSSGGQDLTLLADTCVVPDVMFGVALHCLNESLTPEGGLEAMLEDASLTETEPNEDAIPWALEWMVEYLSVIRRFQIPVLDDFTDWVDLLPFTPDATPWDVDTPPLSCERTYGAYLDDPRYIALASCLIARRLEGEKANILITPLVDEKIYPPVPVKDLWGPVIAIEWYLVAFSADADIANDFASEAAKSKHKLNTRAKFPGRFL